MNEEEDERVVQEIIEASGSNDSQSQTTVQESIDQTYFT